MYSYNVVASLQSLQNRPKTAGATLSLGHAPMISVISSREVSHGAFKTPPELSAAWVEAP